MINGKVKLQQNIYKDLWEINLILNFRCKFCKLISVNTHICYAWYGLDKKINFSCNQEVAFRQQLSSLIARQEQLPWTDLISKCLKCCAEHNRANTSRRMLLCISPDCLIVQPAGCTAAEAVIIRRPQLGWCGHLSWHFPADPLGIGEREGVVGARSLVVKHHPCMDADNPTWHSRVRITVGQSAFHLFFCRETPLVFSSDALIRIKGVLKRKNRWNNNKHTERSELH